MVCSYKKKRVTSNLESKGFRFKPYTLPQMMSRDTGWFTEITALEKNTLFK